MGRGVIYGYGRRRLLGGERGRAYVYIPPYSKLFSV